jgi:hypothetical protein
MAARPCVLTQSGTYGDEGKAAGIATRWRLCYVCVGRNDARQFLTTGGKRGPGIHERKARRQ